MTSAINKANNIFNTINDNFGFLNNKIDNINELSYSTICPGITTAGGIASWSITHNLGSQNIVVSLYNSLGQEQIKNVSITSNNGLTITFKASSNISAGDYKVVVKG